MRIQKVFGNRNILLLAVAMLLSHGCTSTPGAGLELPAESPLIYETLSSDVSLLRADQYIVIDDFNSGNGHTNQMGGSWEVVTTGASQAVLKTSDEDARIEQRGHSIQLNLDVYPGEKMELMTALKGVDVSKAEYLVFKIKTDFQDVTNSAPGLEAPLQTFFDAHMLVTLQDVRGHRVTKNVTSLAFVHHKNWNDVVVPTALFQGLDWNQLRRMTISIEPQTKRARGKLWIDEVAFFGPPLLWFESRKDNLAGFPRVEADSERLQWMLEKARDNAFTKVFLKEVARDTWKYFQNARDRHNHLIVDHVRLGQEPIIADYTSPTNIAMDLMATVVAEDLGFIDRRQAVSRIRGTFSTLSKLKRWKGFFYNYYNTTNLSVTRRFISSVDSGWLAIAFVVVRQAYPQELGRQASSFLNAADFSVFLDPQNNQLTIGYDEEKGELTPHHYGLLVSEARTASYLAIGKGDLPRSHWWFIYRTLPAGWKWQTQSPQGTYRLMEHVEYFQGHYTYADKKFVPSWGGSMFEYLMPTLVLKERELAPQGLGLNNRIATEIQIDYGLESKKYGIWGISPCSTSDGRGWTYGEYGIKAIGSKGYPDKRVITPHASFLALDTLPREAAKNIRNLMDFNMYGDYGFYDSIDLRKRRVNPQYLALDQGMSLVALGNYLRNGLIQNLFHQDPVAKNAEDLLTSERLFAA